MAQTENAIPGETRFSPTSGQHVDVSCTDHSRPISYQPLETISCYLAAHQNIRNLKIGSLHHAWNDHTLSPALDKNTGISVLQSAKNMPTSKYLSDQAQTVSINFTLIS
jgi:hypothetical protein